MKSWDEISQDKRLLKQKVDVDPINRNRFSGEGWLVLNPKKVSEAAKVIFGSHEQGGIMEHISVSFPNRNPTWDEMCIAKDVFWPEEEECYELHPKRSEYINIHPHCLHIWRKKPPKQIEAIPIPVIEAEIELLNIALQFNQGDSDSAKFRSALKETLDWYYSPSYKERLAQCLKYMK